MLRPRYAKLALPSSVLPDAKLLLSARGLRAFGDGYISLLLPYYLTLLGYTAFQIGALVTATLLGSGIMTLLVGFLAHRFRQRIMLYAATALMIATGIAFTLTTDFWPLLLIAALGPINPSGGDASMFGPLEQSLLTRTVDARHRTTLFARYSLIGLSVAACGAQAAALPVFIQKWLGLNILQAIQMMFLLYAVLGALCLLLYRRLSSQLESQAAQAAPVALGKSKRVVYKLAALFSLDSFGGGFAVQSLLALWLFDRFQLSVSAAGTIFFWAGMLSAFSQLFAPWLARRIGLINTMAYTHVTANLFLILVPFMPTLPLALTFLLLRHLLSSMDVPARTSYVMAVVTEGERPAAASVTAVPRSFASAISPMVAGWLLTASPFGWSLVLAGTIKITYDLLLLAQFRNIRPSEESLSSPRD